MAGRFKSGSTCRSLLPLSTSTGQRTRASAVPQDLAPNLGALQEHPLLHGPAAQLRGDDVIGMGVDVQRYIGETAWHSDGFNSEPLPTSETGGWTAKFMLYLDELEEHTGCLWVFPASHLLRGAERLGLAAAVHEVATNHVQTIFQKPRIIFEGALA